MICLMKIATFVVFLLLSFSGSADTPDDAARKIESKWASIYYNPSMNDKRSAYTALLNESMLLSEQYPERAEFYFWQAVIKATNAEHQDGINALISIKQARELLLKAISIDPNTMSGSAYVTLGTLYYMAPGWPIAFGDTQKAEELLQTALKINPEGIDANYYYGDFLLAQNKPVKALKYFKLALKAPIRNEQKFADNQLKTEVERAFKKLLSEYPNKTKNVIASIVSPKKGDGPKDRL